jgi:hypothetical protein
MNSEKNQLFFGQTERSIRQTLGYLRLVRLAVTPEELYRYLWQPPVGLSYTDFLSVRAQMGLQSWRGCVVETVQDREIVEERRRSVVPTELMLRQAHRAVRFVAWVPFLEAVFVCNSVGSETARPESDIDWLVITRPGRIWLVRALLNIVLRLAGLRTYGNHEAGRICLSFFIDHDHLDLAPLRALPEDIHFAYWLHQMVPVYGSVSWYPRFVEANSWTKQYVPFLHTSSITVLSEPAPPGRLAKGIKYVLEWSFGGKLGNHFERLAHVLQYRKLKPSLKEKSRRPETGVVIASGVLKFHERDTRQEIYECWKTSLGNEKIASG